MGGGSFLPYIQLCGSAHDAVKDGSVPVGTYVLFRGKEKILLGKNPVFLVLSQRATALRYKAGDRCHNVGDELFKEIMREADQGDQGAGYGPEFLVWLPDQSCFALFGMFSKTARNVAPSIAGPFGRNGIFCCTMGSELITGRKPPHHKWHGPTVIEYNMELETSPTADAVMEERNRFLNPPKAAPKGEKVEETSDR